MINTKIVSSLEKIFPDEEPVAKPECTNLSGLKKETVSFQIAYYGNVNSKEYVHLEIDSDIKDWIRVRTVELVPSALPCNAVYDDNYLRTTPGMFPDLLRDLKNNQVPVIAHQWRALWIDITIPEDADPGNYKMSFIMQEDSVGEILDTKTTKIKVIDAMLPEQRLIHTEWFHADCLADYYHLRPWSDEYWSMLENFIQEYGSRGMNAILTPVLTPPLDTAVGGERTTIQLAVIEKNGDGYNFDFSRLKTWIDICYRYGIRYFEVAHLFTQWGATSAPKVMAWEDGKPVKIFGWETKSDSLEYSSFLKQFLTALTEQFRKWGIVDQVYFHTSDEPSEEHLEAYQAARQEIDPYIKGFKTLDALSDYSFYERGLVEKPVPGTNHIEPFLKAEVPGLWTYYCTAQSTEVSNRFMSMPSARNRILGVQLYKFGIEGFLQWGFNFYNSQYSLEHINPYAVTDAGSAFPSGDAFLVYPGEEKKPEESLRLMNLFHAMQDIRAMELLESMIGKDEVIKEMEKDLSEEITFKRYPTSDVWLLGFRERINDRIETCVRRAQ
ncbi:DUF4091 domain-containing protein [Blautia liquoris]|uniref:DUF4091 domain-containing protein n=1 Tax=Blautia liquoris TaxID=2779518 RepID=A0A7M2REK4_9FIRM|nr:DUF4091 domain-containing protein [Blautia liquoris]